MLQTDLVLLPYEITLFSNHSNFAFIKFMVLLPYEITLFSNDILEDDTEEKFYYLMKLHYSQTISNSISIWLVFYYLMKLHYSQTFKNQSGEEVKVLLPYEITLFSNEPPANQNYQLFYYLMKLHYSQTSSLSAVTVSRFYYLMKLHYSQTKRCSRR